MICRLEVVQEKIFFPDKGQTAATAKTPDTAEHTVTFEDDLDERGDS
jgi:hypothetical protein